MENVDEFVNELVVVFLAILSGLVLGVLVAWEVDPQDLEQTYQIVLFDDKVGVVVLNQILNSLVQEQLFELQAAYKVPVGQIVDQIKGLQMVFQD